MKNGDDTKGDEEQECEDEGVDEGGWNGDKDSVEGANDGGGGDKLEGDRADPTRHRGEKGRAKRRAHHKSESSTVRKSSDISGALIT